jgi:hypothetical protein
VVVGVAVLLGSSLAGTAAATAAPAPQITICHGTHDPAHPYERITVSENALKGHSRHVDDIIPAPSTGCAPVAPVDLCPNIAGDQATVPAGMIVDPASGNCITPVIQQCSTATTSGGAGVTTTVSELGTTGPTSFLFQFDAQSVPDRFQIYYQNAPIYDSDWRGATGYTDDAGNPITVVGPGVGSATVNVPAGTATSVTVVVTGGASGTAWSYTVNCPAAAPAS